MEKDATAACRQMKEEACPALRVRAGRVGGDAFLSRSTCPEWSPPVEVPTDVTAFPAVRRG